MKTSLLDGRSRSRSEGSPQSVLSSAYQQSRKSRHASYLLMPVTFLTFHLGFDYPLLGVALHQCLPLSSVAFLFQVVPSSLAMSSCHFLLGRPLDLFRLLGCHSVQRLVHLLSFILAICPTHLHFCFSVYSKMAVMFVLVLISEQGVISCSFRCNIFLSIAL